MNTNVRECAAAASSCVYRRLWKVMIGQISHYRRKSNSLFFPFLLHHHHLLLLSHHFFMDIWMHHTHVSSVVSTFQTQQGKTQILRF